MPLEMMQSRNGGGARDGAAARGAQLRDLADEALRRACGAARLGDVVDEETRELMRRSCDVAHERGLQAEQLLLLLKQAWRELPEAQRLPHHEAGDGLARVITVCIHEYYARGDAG